MAKVKIEVDTELGTVTIDVDGQSIAGINDVSVYCGENYDGEMSADVRFCKSEKQENMRVTTYYSVAAVGKAGAEIKEVDAGNKVNQEIGQFFKNRRK